MFDKSDRIRVFNDTLNCINNNPDIKKLASHSMINTYLYKDNIRVSIENHFNYNGNISIINQRSLQACKGFEDIAVLNFASATNPGGGVLKGSNAQEECLCRCSTLYKCLNTKELWDNYYLFHREKKDTLYTDSVIYSQEVLVFKEDLVLPTMLSKDDWYKVNVLTCPAPNISKIEILEDDLFEIFKKRIRKILSVAIINRNKNIVLGAFGCGAFKNPPELVAKAFKEILIDEGYRYDFNNIIFAIITPRPNDINNLIAFQNEFKNYL